jgi:CHAD domain-containing protein
MARSPIEDAIQGDAPQFAIDQARGQLQRLSLQINRAIKSCTADAVHDVRVAIRRFAQAIAVSQPYLPAAHLRKNRKRLKKIMAGAGEVRNCDVALKLIAKFRTPHAVPLRSKVNTGRKEAERLLVSQLKDWTERKIALKFLAVLDSGPAAGRKQGIPELAHDALGRIAKEFVKKGKEASLADASPKGMHHFRIVTKKFRYALELFQPVYKSSLDPIVASIKAASALLGDINDCVTVAAMVADYRGGAQLADRLKKRRHKKTGEFRKYWKEEFSDGDRLRSAIEHLRLPGPFKKPVASSRTADHRQQKSA